MEAVQVTGSTMRFCFVESDVAVRGICGNGDERRHKMSRQDTTGSREVFIMWGSGAMP